MIATGSSPIKTKMEVSLSSGYNILYVTGSLALTLEERVKRSMPKRGNR